MEGLKVDLSAADAAFAGSVDAALLMAEHAKAAGIEINVIREPNDGYWDNVWLKKAMVPLLLGWPPNGRHDAHGVARCRCRLERHALEEPTLQRVAAAGPR